MKKMEEPKVELVELGEDIITSSGGCGADGCSPDCGNVCTSKCSTVCAPNYPD